MQQATTNIVPTVSNRVPLVVGAWLALGSTIAFAAPIRDIPQLAPAFIVTSVLGWVLAYRRGGAVRRWADALPTRALIAAHALRLPIGAALVWEGARGTVSPLFADRAGWGDMAVGIAAILVSLFAWQRPRLVRLFALFGLGDILVALGTTMYLLFVVRDPVMLDALTIQPYPLLPFALVPAVIVTHLLMLARTGHTRR